MTGARDETVKAPSGAPERASPLTRVEIWGVLNVTPDSFSDGGRFLAVEAALAHAARMHAEGADVLDVGGESSRPPGRTYGPGADEVSAEEETARVLPVVSALVGRGLRVSVDTVKAPVAEAALRAGAAIINDVSCGRDPALLRVVAESRAELVLMHNRGRGERSGANVAYVDVVGEVRDELLRAVERATLAGVRPESIWLDPGVGFAKTAAQSAALIAATPRLVATGHRVLVGASRKSFLAELTVPQDGALPGPTQRLGGSLAAATMAVLGGARAVRVHDVRETQQAVRLTERMVLLSQQGGSPA